jgi:hypothetical protein
VRFGKQVEFLDHYLYQQGVFCIQGKSQWLESEDEEDESEASDNEVGELKLDQTPVVANMQVLKMGVNKGALKPSVTYEPEGNIVKDEENKKFRCTKCDKGFAFDYEDTLKLHHQVAH